MRWQPVGRLLARFLPPALVGAFALLGFAPYSFWPVVVLSLALLFGLIDAAATPRRAALVAWAWGFGFFTATIHWIFISLHTYGGMPAIVAILAIVGLAAFLALYPALAAFLARKLAGQSRTGLLLTALPALWLLIEWLRGWLFTGFPWGAVGYSQMPDGPLAGFAPIIGVYGVSGLVALLAGVAVWLISRQFQLSDKLALLAAVLLCGAGYGLKQVVWTEPAGKPLKVALLQGAIPQNQKWGIDDLIYNLRTYYHLVKEAKADLIVLPETAFPIFLHEVPDDYLEAVLSYATAQNAALIAGAPRQDGKSERYYNGAVLLTDPARPSNYKAHLVPFGEYIPIRPVFGWVYDNILQMPLVDFSSGGAVQKPLPVRDQRIAANICYEDVFGEELLPNARQATILLNLSNLAWFDGSVALAQHGQISQTRALETGRPMLRATNSGTTAVITPDGHYAARLPERVEGTLYAMVQGMQGETPYMWWGNVAALLLAAVGLAIALIARRRARFEYWHGVESMDSLYIDSSLTSS
ncbi:apolipoprotein N-acyltransferase [Chitinimonas sp. BJB300]|uniref:apolipoprotein N-acyltransferase n=1 Tax=Chitinimonas sp. BJB300 TaxID=1559339 RepID=UPI000C103A22|nr:apolipoprotein N-acyltransferase [Chitinimonas sp. BJB300]PHV12000.1 apolipoprotein N-acyltransferase [Chitinimonas sp. BJB300]